LTPWRWQGINFFLKSKGFKWVVLSPVRPIWKGFKEGITLYQTLRYSRWEPAWNPGQFSPLFWDLPNTGIFTTKKKNQVSQLNKAWKKHSKKFENGLKNIEDWQELKTGCWWEKTPFKGPQWTSPPGNREGWMISGQETIFCWVSVP
jgi:hypothetical protein